MPDTDQFDVNISLSEVAAETTPDNVDLAEGEIIIKFSLDDEDTGAFKVETFTKCDFPYLVLMTAGLLSMTFSNDEAEIEKLLARGNDFLMQLQSTVNGTGTVQ